jgi:LmbE family N-acetylglucosaminyl deacetylase
VLSASLLGSVDSVLCIGAHPDDIEIGCGGTLLTLTTMRPSARVRWLVMTGSGERREEARRSAVAFLGDASGLTLHDFRDGYLPYDEPGSVKTALFEVRDAEPPDLVLAPRLDDAHQDHRFLAELAQQVFRDQVVLGYEIPKPDGDLGSANLYVPISETAAMTKVARLIDLYPSQRGKPWFRREVFEGLLRLRGSETAGEAAYAEAFRTSRLVLR